MAGQATQARVSAVATRGTENPLKSPARRSAGLSKIQPHEGSFGGPDPSGIPSILELSITAPGSSGTLKQTTSQHLSKAPGGKGREIHFSRFEKE